MNVAFLYAPVVHKSFEENLRVVDEDFGRMTPVGLAYAAALAERAGHRVCVVDANVEGLSIEDVIARLEPFKPQVIASSFTTYMFQDTARWLLALREHFGVPTIAGGINARLFPAEMLAHPGIDYAVIDYATQGLPLLLAALEEGRSPLGLTQVVAQDANGRTVVGPSIENENPFAVLPPPARHLLPMSKYYSFISQRRPFTVMVTATGCRYNCSFCAIAPLPLNVNPLERVFAEISDCVNTHGVREIDFFDADFLVDRRRTRALCEWLCEQDFDLEWSCRARVDSLDHELLPLLRSAGCRQIYLGIETPNPESQRRMHKRLRPDTVRQRLIWLREAGIRPLGFFMLGVPGETHASCLQTIRYALSLPLDYAQFSRTIAKPGSEMYNELVERTGLDYWRDFVLGKPVPPRLPNIWTELDDAAIERYTKLAYIAFYYRPGYILKALGRTRSLDELWRSARTAGRMLANTLHHDHDKGRR